MKTILVPIDFSPATRPVLRVATKLARLVKARLVLVHAIRIPVITDGYGVVNESAVILELSTKSAERALARTRERLKRAGFRVSSSVVPGDPAYAIVQEAKAVRADYIVVASHGHSLFYDVVIGSVTAAVVRKSPCPVVVVPYVQNERKG